jgi:hypothetical protein
LNGLPDFFSIQVRKRFMIALGEDLRTVATDPFASHVLQKLMLISTFSEKVKLRKFEKVNNLFEIFLKTHLTVYLKQFAIYSRK